MICGFIHGLISKTPQRSPALSAQISSVRSAFSTVLQVPPKCIKSFSCRCLYLYKHVPQEGAFKIKGPGTEALSRQQYAAFIVRCFRAFPCSQNPSPAPGPRNPHIRYRSPSHRAAVKGQYGSDAVCFLGSGKHMKFLLLLTCLSALGYGA
jgi:hypothetical protein